MKFSQEESDSVALSEEELRVLYDLKLNYAQTRARDIAILGCYVGLRTKDLKRINEFKLRGNLFEVLTNKTKAKVVIPLHPLAKSIIEKYGEGNIPVIGTSSMNLMLPRICKKAAEIQPSFKREVLITITTGGVKRGQYFKHWQLVSTHTLRRSFCTNAYKAGVPILRIMKISGHKTETAFLKYIKIEKEENANELLDHPFFSNKKAPVQ